jgi:hypothetical protein
MNRHSWWGRQLQREDLITTLEQGRRVEVELFQEKHRGLRTMGELLKARVFGATEWAISLRMRMTNYRAGVGEHGSYPDGDVTPRPRQRHSTTPSTPAPHKFPCEDPYCEPCTEAIKRIFRDLNLLPSGNPDRASYTADPLTGRLKVPSRYRKDESDK